MSGPLQVPFRQWVAPELGQRARDPVQAPDGSIWYVGQQSTAVYGTPIEAEPVEEEEAPQSSGVLTDSLIVTWRNLKRIELALYPGGAHGFMREPGPNTDRARTQCRDFIARQLAFLQQ